MCISDWSSDVCSSYLRPGPEVPLLRGRHRRARPVRGRVRGKHTVGRNPRSGFRRTPSRFAGSATFACGGNAFGGSALLLRKHRGGGDSPTHPPPPAGEGRSCRAGRSEEHTSELQSLMRISYAVFCLKKTNHSQLTTKNIYNYKL